MTSQLPLIPESVPPLDELERRAKSCHACKLHSTRKSVVFGVGNTGQPLTSMYASPLTDDERIDKMIAEGKPKALTPKVPLAVLGEAPGYHEDQQGEPFVGASGTLLNKMLAAMKYDRSDVYILNCVNCRPPGNREPEKDELAACSQFVVGQLLNVRPKVILALGNVAARTLIDTSAPVGQLRGRWWEWRDIPVRVSYHPAALLREESLKRFAWDDLKEVLRFLLAAQRLV